MDKSFHQDKPNIHQLISYFIRLPVVDSLFKWLAVQIGITEEEQEKAGVYLGGEGRD